MEDSPVVVVTDPEASDVVRFAEEELLSHLRKSLRPDAGQSQETSGREKLTIRLGAPARTELLRHRPAMMKKLTVMPAEGYVIEQVDGAVNITGKDDTGTLRGTHQFIEDHLGVRWYFPDDSIIPQKGMAELRASIKHGCRRAEAPTFSHRAFSHPITTDWLNWMSRNRYNSVDIGWPSPGSAEWGRIRKLSGDIHRRGIKISVSGHHLLSLLSPERYFDEHPEWFALIDGRRDRRRRQLFCTSSGEATEVFLENLRKYVTAVPEVDRFDFWPEDGCRCCQCDSCTEAPESDRYVRLANEMVRVIHSIYPDKPLSLFAYGTFRPAPKRAVLDKSVQVQFCWWGRDYAIPFNHEECAVHNDRAYLDAGHGACWDQFGEFMKWAGSYAKTNGLLIYDQHMNQSIRGPNLLPIPHLSEDYRWFESIGITGLIHPLSGTNHWVCGLNAYVVGKMLWDRKLSRQALLEDFFKSYFGVAASEMQRLYETIDRGFPHMRRTYHATLRKARNFNLYGTWSHKPQRRYPSDLKDYNEHSLEALDDCDRLLSTARKRVQERSVGRRLRKVAVYLQYLRCSRESIAKQIEARDLVKESMYRIAGQAASLLIRASGLYREALRLERVQRKIFREHRHEGLIWDDIAWSRRIWDGKPRVEHFPRGITGY